MLSAGPIAFTFSYCPFHGQMGMQFWLLIGAFEGLAQGEERKAVAAWRGKTGKLSRRAVADVPDSRDADA